MTSNQINYAKLQEDKRHNIVSEKESARHNRRSEDVGYYTGGAAYAGVAENKRHNLEQESINWYTAENLGGLQQAQTAKTTSEVGVEQGKLDETGRHNKSTESQALRTQDEVNRHNRIMEQQNDRDLDIKTWNAGVNTVGVLADSWKDVTQGLVNFGKFGGAAGVAPLFK